MFIFQEDISLLWYEFSHFQPKHDIGLVKQRTGNEVFLVHLNSDVESKYVEPT